MTATKNKTITVGDEQIRLEPFSGRKAIRVIRTIEHITQGVPEILDRWADFTREYEARNVTEMDRATARHYYAPQVIMVEEPVLAADGVTAIVNTSGSPMIRRTPKLDDAGRPVLGPDPLAHMSDEDWAASGNKLRLPKAPSTEERIAAIFPMAMRLAEDEVTQLLAVLATPNADLKRKARDGSLKEYIVERADELIDAPMTDLLELAVASGEMVDEQITSKIKQLGDRLPNALRLFGMDLGSQTKPQPKVSKSASKPTKRASSTDSPPPTDGEKAESSTEPIGAAS